MKKFFSIFLILSASALLFAQSIEYQKFMKRAKSYEEKNYWIFAMADYYQAMEAEPTELAEDAYTRFYEIRDALASGAPAPADAFNMEETDDFEIHDRWAFLYKEYNSFWSKHSPVSFEFSKWYKAELNYETKTAKYYSDVSVKWSRMYNIIHDAIYQGYKKAYRHDWIDLDVSWNADVKELSSYSLVFNLSDPEGNIIAQNQEIKTDGYRKPFYIDNISKKNMKTFDANEVVISLVQVKINDVPTKISLKDIHVKFPDGTGHLDTYITDTLNTAINEKKYRLEEEARALEAVRLEEERRIEEEKKQEEARAALLLTQEEFKNKSPKMIKIEGGTFTMGVNLTTLDTVSTSSVNIHPAHSVNIGGFKMSATEITQKQFEQVMGYNPSKFVDKRNPVESLTWMEAIAFCNKASEIKGYKPCYSINGETNPDLWEYESVYIEEEDESYEYWGNRKKTVTYKHYIGELKCNFNRNGYRLPTEAEWEYAAKEGNLNSSFEYSGSDEITEIAWCKKNCSEPHSVGKRIPNALGLYDMTGNVAEFCWDSYDYLYYEYSTDNNPTGPVLNDFKMVRGGSYETTVNNTTRENTYLSKTSSKTGFRIVQSTEKRVWNELTPDQKVASKVEEFLNNGPKMILINPDKAARFYVGKYEVTQYEWKAIMGTNPSKFNYNLENPVEEVGYLQCIYFCNKLSEKFGYTPCYEVDGNLNADEWDYDTSKENTKSTKVTCNFKANGFRLLTQDESRIIKKYDFNSDKGTCWTYWNGMLRTHPRGSSKPDIRGLHDVIGNVTEWSFEVTNYYYDYDILYNVNSNNGETIMGLRLARSYIQKQ